MRKRRKCRLCLAEKDLCVSHLLPAAFYRRLRDNTSVNPNPVLINSTYSVQSSLQVTDHLLCENCEHLLSHNGEQYVIASAFDGQNFPLQEALSKLKPAVSGPKIQAVACASVPSVDVDQLAYFALSVFWRAGAHEWHAKGGTTISIHLGRQYEEEFRVYLLGGSGFPGKAAIWVVVSSDPDPFPAFCFPFGGRQAGYHRYRFAVPGIEFLLFVGNQIPENVRRMCSFSSPDRFIYVTSQVDQNTLNQLSRLASTSKQTASVASVIRSVLAS